MSPVWTKLRPAIDGEGIPTPPARSVVAELTGRPGALAGETTAVGQGFDRRRYQVRTWGEPESLPSPRFSFGGQPVVSGPLPEWMPKAEAVKVDRAWTADEIVAVERHARRILASHDFPLTGSPDDFAWEWRDGDLWWAEPHADRPGLLSEWLRVQWGADFLRSWPKSSPFVWAAEVWTRCRAIRVAQAEPAERGAADLLVTSAFELGSFLAQETMRQLYEDDVVTLEADRDRRRAGGRTTAALQSRHLNEALQLAATLRRDEPSLSTAALAARLREAGGPALPSVGRLQRVIAGWEKADKLPRSTQNRTRSR